MRQDDFKHPTPRPNVVVGDVVEYDGGGLSRFGRVEAMQGPYWARVLLANGTVASLPTDSLRKCADPIRALAALSLAERSVLLPAEAPAPPPEGQPPGPEWLGGLLDAQ